MKVYACPCCSGFGVSLAYEDWPSGLVYICSECNAVWKRPSSGTVLTGTPGVPDMDLATTPATKMDPGRRSDGYHTFNELYCHRHALFGLLVQLMDGWKSREHGDGSSISGWFIAGITTEHGPVTYHLPDSLWETFPGREVNKAPEWDGHTSQDVIARLMSSWQAGQNLVPAEADGLKEFTVAWSINVRADRYRNAAEEALRIMKDPGEALVFSVADGCRPVVVPGSIPVDLMVYEDQ